jgi:hypothetical protein
MYDASKTRELGMKKPPEGGFSVSWWPGAESNQGLGCLTLVLDCPFKRRLAKSCYLATMTSEALIIPQT